MVSQTWSGFESMGGVAYLQNLVELSERGNIAYISLMCDKRKQRTADLHKISKDDIAVGFEDSKSHEQNKIGGVVIGPQDFP